MVVAALAFEVGMCRDDPDRLLRMPIARLMYWYDLAVSWRREVNKAQQGLQSRQARQQNMRNVARMRVINR